MDLKKNKKIIATECVVLAPYLVLSLVVSIASATRKIVGMNRFSPGLFFTYMFICLLVYVAIRTTVWAVMVLKDGETDV
jgi:integral membrane sensor domain MASE1